MKKAFITAGYIQSQQISPAQFESLLFNDIEELFNSITQMQLAINADEEIDEELDSLIMMDDGEEDRISIRIIKRIIMKVSLLILNNFWFILSLSENLFNTFWCEMIQTFDIL